MKTEVNGKVVNIDDKEIEKMVKVLDITKEEAIETILFDKGLIDNEEVEETEKKAKENKVKLVAGDIGRGKRSTPKTVKVSDVKVELFSKLKNFLLAEYGEEIVTITKENKKIDLNLGQGISIDVVEHTYKKNK